MKWYYICASGVVEQPDRQPVGMFLRSESLEALAEASASLLELPPSHDRDIAIFPVVPLTEEQEALLRRYACKVLPLAEVDKFSREWSGHPAKAVDVTPCPKGDGPPN